MTAQELRQKYLDFFKSKGHTIIPSASLVPENDPSVLFTTAGMHPLVPYLLGEKHPGGTRVANVQKCVRTGDIDEVGDNRHLTFFEMMGNWSFGDYFKKEAIEWSFEFLTDEKWLGLDKNRLYFTVFKGENDIPRDEEAIATWKAVLENNGVSSGVAGDDEIIRGNIRIIPLGTEDNFWIAGATGPCGGDTEMFYDTHPELGPIDGKFSELVASGRIIEIWNNVFMEYKKIMTGEYTEEAKKLLDNVNLSDDEELSIRFDPKSYVTKIEILDKKNVDTGMGVERTLAVLNGKKTVFETELFVPIFEKISDVSGKKYDEHQREFRIIADHIKAAVFMIADGVEPSNKERGYVLRRLIRRAIAIANANDKNFSFDSKKAEAVALVVMDIYSDAYQEFKQGDRRIDMLKKLSLEIRKFRATIENGFKSLEVGIKKIEKYLSNPEGNVTYRNNNGQLEQAENFFCSDIATLLFDLYQNHGFPLELAKELVFEGLKNKGVKLDEEKIIGLYNSLFKKHQDLSRTASVGAFKGGLQAAGEMETKYHTATHLLLAALREILGPETYQKGSNITAERLRFDFNYPQKMTAEQIKAVEDLVNQKIGEKIPVEMIEMDKNEALKIAKVSFDPEKYGDKVKVYKIGDYSIELCGGPHVANTGDLGRFRIVKEEASSAGVRRIKAVLE